MFISLESSFFRAVPNCFIEALIVARNENSQLQQRDLSQSQQQWPLMPNQQQRDLSPCQLQRPLISSQQQRPLMPSQQQRGTSPSQQQQPLMPSQQQRVSSPSQQQRPLMPSQQQWDLPNSQQQRPLMPNQQHRPQQFSPSNDWRRQECLTNSPGSLAHRTWTPSSSCSSSSAAAYPPSLSSQGGIKCANLPVCLLVMYVCLLCAVSSFFHFWSARSDLYIVLVLSLFSFFYSFPPFSFPFFKSFKFYPVF